MTTTKEPTVGEKLAAEGKAQTKGKAHLTGAVMTVIGAIIAWISTGDVPAGQEWGAALGILGTAAATGIAGWVSAYAGVNRVVERSHAFAILPGAALALTAIVGACTPQPGDDRSLLERALPNTTAGFERGGIVGATEGFTGAFGVICERLDGAEFTAAVNAAALAFDLTEQTEAVREVRQDLCERGAAVAGLAGVWSQTGEVVEIEGPPAPTEAAVEPIETPATEAAPTL